MGANGTALWRLAEHVVATGDRRFWTGARSLWPAIRPIWRPAVHRRLWIQPRVGYATSGSGVGQLQQPQWGGQQQRQLSQQDVSEVVRQLVPVLPQILA